MYIHTAYTTLSGVVRFRWHRSIGYLLVSNVYMYTTLSEWCVLGGLALQRNNIYASKYYFADLNEFGHV